MMKKDGKIGRGRGLEVERKKMTGGEEKETPGGKGKGKDGDTTRTEEHSKVGREIERSLEKKNVWRREERKQIERKEIKKQDPADITDSSDSEIEVVGVAIPLSNLSRARPPSSLPPFSCPSALKKLSASSYDALSSFPPPCTSASLPAPLPSSDSLSASSPPQNRKANAPRCRDSRETGGEDKEEEKTHASAEEFEKKRQSVEFSSCRDKTEVTQGSCGEERKSEVGVKAFLQRPSEKEKKEKDSSNVNTRGKEEQEGDVMDKIDEKQTVFISSEDEDDERNNMKTSHVTPLLTHDEKSSHTSPISSSFVLGKISPSSSLSTLLPPSRLSRTASEEERYQAERAQWQRLREEKLRRMRPIREQFMCQQHPSVSSTASESSALQEDSDGISPSLEKPVESEKKGFVHSLDSSSSLSSSSSLVCPRVSSPKDTTSHRTGADLTSFILDKLQLLAGKYEEQGEVWRAQGFRIASGAIRLRCGVAANAAAKAREEAQKRRGEKKTGTGGENKNESKGQKKTQSNMTEEEGKGRGEECVFDERRTENDKGETSGMNEDEEKNTHLSFTSIPRLRPAYASSSYSSSTDRLRIEGITRENYKLLKGEPGVGKSIFQTIEELVLTGTTRRLDSLVLGARPKALEDLQRIWGVGFHTAEKLYALGIYSVADLRKAVTLLDEKERRRLSEQECRTREVYVHPRNVKTEDKADHREEKEEERRIGGEGEVARRSLQILDDIFGPQIHTDIKEGRRASSAWLSSGVHTPQPFVIHGKNHLASFSSSKFSPIKSKGSENSAEGLKRPLDKTEEAARLLSRPQRLGLMYVEAFEKRIPRDEVTAIASFIQTQILSASSVHTKKEEETLHSTPDLGERKISSTDIRVKEEQKEEDEGHDPEKKKVKSEVPQSFLHRIKREKPRSDAEDPFLNPSIKRERRIKEDQDKQEEEGTEAFSLSNDIFVGMEVCGSYRRGKADCGDIDILLIRRNHVPKGALKGVISLLTEKGLLVDHLLINEELGLHHSTDTSSSSSSSSSHLARSKGRRKKKQGKAREGTSKEEEEHEEEEGEMPEKDQRQHEISSSHLRSKRVAELYCGVCVWPPRPMSHMGATIDRENHGDHSSFPSNTFPWIGPRLPRRIDIKIYPEVCRAFALLYFTGSAQFNRSMRTWAKKVGYSLDDTGLYPRTTSFEAFPSVFPISRRFSPVNQSIQKEEEDKLRDSHEEKTLPWIKNDEGSDPTVQRDSQRVSSSTVSPFINRRSQESGSNSVKSEVSTSLKDQVKLEEGMNPLEETEMALGSLSPPMTRMWRRQRSRTGIVWKGRRGEHCRTEREIFESLELKYVPPHARDMFIEPTNSLGASSPATLLSPSTSDTSET